MRRCGGSGADDEDVVDSDTESDVRDAEADVDEDSGADTGVDGDDAEDDIVPDADVSEDSADSADVDAGVPCPTEWATIARTPTTADQDPDGADMSSAPGPGQVRLG